MPTELLSEDNQRYLGCIEAQQLARHLADNLKQLYPCELAETSCTFGFFTDYKHIQKVKMARELAALCEVDYNRDIAVVRLLNFYKRIRQVNGQLDPGKGRFGKMLDDYDRVVQSLEAKVASSLEQLTEETEKNEAKLTILIHLLAKADEYLLTEKIGDERATDVIAIPTIAYHHHVYLNQTAKLHDNDFTSMANQSDQGIMLYPREQKEFLQRKIAECRFARIRQHIQHDILHNEIVTEDVNTLIVKYVAREVLEYFDADLVQKEKALLLKWYICMPNGDLREKLLAEINNPQSTGILCTKEIAQIVKYNIENKTDVLAAEHTNLFANGIYNNIYEEITDRLSKLTCLERYKILHQFYDPKEYFSKIVMRLLSELEMIESLVKLTDAETPFVANKNEVELTGLIHSARATLQEKLPPQPTLSQQQNHPTLA